MPPGVARWPLGNHCVRVWAGEEEDPAGRKAQLKSERRVHDRKLDATTVRFGDTQRLCQQWFTFKLTADFLLFNKLFILE